MKKLYRSEENKVWKGVIGGFGEYFNIDPVLIRIIFVFFVLATGIVPGVLTYIIAIFVIPKKGIPDAEIVGGHSKE
jgi:phage shock protein C